MSERINAFRQAKRLFEDKDQEIRSVGTAISRIGDALRTKPGMLVFEDYGGHYTANPAWAHGAVRAKTTDLKTSQDVIGLIEDWGRLKQEMSSAYQALNQTEKQQEGPSPR